MVEANKIEVDRRELELKHVRLQAKSGNNANLTQYQQDLLKWSENVDKGYAWVILFVLWCLLNCCLLACRMYGIIYAKITEIGEYTREEASLPSSMMFIFENLLGPVISILSFYMPIRMSFALGEFLLGAGNTLAYFSDGILLDSIGAGMMQGIGLSFIMMPMLSLINQWFYKYRNIAFGTILSGGTLSVYYFGPLFRYIIAEYHYRNTYLALGVINFLALILMPFIKSNKRPEAPEDQRINSTALAVAGIAPQVMEIESSLNSLKSRSSFRSGSTIVFRRRGADGSALRSSIVSVKPFSTTTGETLTRSLSRSILQRQYSQNQLESLAHQQQQQQQPQQHDSINHDQDSSNATGVASTGANKEVVEQQQSIVDMSVMAAAAAATTSSPDKVDLLDIGKSHNFDSAIILKILVNVPFHLTWLVEALYYWVFSVFTIVIIDLAVDQGIDFESANFLIGYWSLGELTGRLVLTVLVDLKYLSNRAVIILILLINFLALVSIPYAANYYIIAILVAIVSAISSLSYIMINGLLVDSLGEEQVTLGFGMASFLAGILMLARTPIVGLCRDRLKTYSPLIIGMGVASAICSLLWFIETLYHNKKLADEEKRNNDMQDELDIKRTRV